MRCGGPDTTVLWGSAATVSRTSRLVLTALIAALVLVAPAASALVAPGPHAPDDGATVTALPAFKWDAGRGRRPPTSSSWRATRRFNSPILNVTTKNTRAALKDLVANGTYYWRVRGVTSTGDARRVVGGRGRSTCAWTAQPPLLAPTDGATITYPSERARAQLGRRPRAPRSTSSRSRPTRSSARSSGPSRSRRPRPRSRSTTRSRPARTTGTSRRWTPRTTRGVRRRCASFTWSWPSTTDADVTDLVAAPEVFDPRFSWDPVEGAAGYEVEVNFSSDWAEGSKVCCDPIKGQHLHARDVALARGASSPTTPTTGACGRSTPSNNAGVWNEGPTFTKTFDNVPPVTAPSIKNLRMRDNARRPGVDTDGGTAVARHRRAQSSPGIPFREPPATR